MSLFSNAQINLNNGLVGHFKFDGNALDSSPIAIHGTANNATLTLGKTNNVDSAYFFNGLTTYVDYTSDSRGITNTITVSAWVKTTNVNNEWVVSKYDWTIDKGFHLVLVGGHPVLAGRNNGGVYITTNYPNPSNLVNDGQWHHIVGEISENSWALWVDCVLDNQVTSNANNPSLVNTFDLTIGNYIMPSGNHVAFFDGSIDEVRIFNRTLTQAERGLLCDINYVDPVLSAPVVSNDTAVCDLTVLTLTAQSDSGMIYWESPLGTLIDSGNTHTATITQNITFYVYSVLNGVYSDTAIIQVDTMFCGPVYPPPFVTDTVVCVGEQFNIISHPDSGVVHWESPLGNPVTTGDTLVVTATANQQFFVYIVYTTGTSDTISFKVNTKDCSLPIPPPKAPHGDSICIGTGITFHARSDTGLVYWLDSSGAILDTGLIYVTVITEDVTYYLYTDVNGKLSDTVSFKMIAIDCRAPLFPNVFTPNGDGVNDYFYFTIPYATCFDLVIYNRWGVEVFKSNRLEFGWNGRIQSSGAPVSDGVYFYALTYCVNGESSQTKTGSVTILR